jgi:pimeloyl-ACP methyl ester carboxylesterase
MGMMVCPVARTNAMIPETLPRRIAPYLLVMLLPALLLCQVSRAAPDEDYPPAIVELTIDSGGYRLPAMAYLADGRGPHPTVLLLHGFPGNEKNLDIAQSLRRAGFNVVFFHYRGAWGADGEYSVVTLPDDVAAVLRFLRTPETVGHLRVDTGHLSLLGHSMGGYAALAAGARDKALVCVGAMSPGNPGDFKRAIEAGDPAGDWILQYADTLFMLRGYSGAKMKQELAGVTLEEVDLRGYGPGLAGKSVLLVNGDKDTVTPVDTMFKPIVEAYRHTPGLALEADVISGDHSYSWSREELTSLVEAWLLRDCR